MSYQEDTPEATAECYRCGQSLAADEQKCPRCGRRQYRICFCGRRIAITLTKCPHCGADWSSSHRGRREKRRTSRVEPQAIVKSAVIGAVSALALMAIFHILLRYFARLGSDTGAIPGDLGGQLGMAQIGIRKVLGFWFEAASSRSDALLGVTVGLVIGGGIGIIIYLTRIGLLRFSRSRSRSGGQRGRRRR